MTYSLALFLFKIGFIEIGFADILDILVLTILFFFVYRLLKGSLAFNIFVGLLVLSLIYFIVQALEMKMMERILGQFLGAGLVLLVIIFQPEIRRFLFFLGRNTGIGDHQFWKRLLKKGRNNTSNNELLVNFIAKALQNLARTKTGALMVFTDIGEEKFFATTGVPIHAEISSKLIETIFDKHTPLHDGAMVIADGKILAAGCVLPVSENPELPPRVGMRHRAAVGITENIEAHVFIVSEERGKISYAYRGNIRMNISNETLRELLIKALEV